jgi:hypothetical protein
VREALGALRLRSLDATLEFTADVDELIAATPQPVQDLEAALVERLGKFDLVINNQTVTVPAIVEVPEAPVAPTLPYVRITPWAIVPMAELAGSAESVDNFTDQGAHLRPPPRRLVLDYRIDVHATERAHKTSLLDRVLADLGARAQLAVAGELLDVAPFAVSPVEAVVTPPGRTPLFLRVTATMEAGPRVFQPRAVPFLVAGVSRGSAEMTSL